MPEIINSLNEIENHISKIKCPIILFSGGLDSRYLATLLEKKYGLTPYCLKVNIGQTESNEKPNSNIKINKRVIDKKETFANEYIAKAIQNSGLYGNGHYLSSSLSRPLMVETALEFAEKVGSNCILHCATPSQNSLRRLNTSFKDLGFSGIFGSPFVEDNITRIEKMTYLESLGVSVNPSRIFSQDTNLWCREFESGELENLESFHIPENQFLWTQVKGNSPTQKISLRFTKGKLTHLNDTELTLTKIIETLNPLVGQYGIGRQVSLEEGPMGKVVEARECPAAHLISKAYYDLLTLKYSRKIIEEKMTLDQRWSTLACEGHWFSPEKKAIEKYNQEIASNMTGEAHYTLSHAGIILNGVREHLPIKSPHNTVISTNTFKHLY